MAHLALILAKAHQCGCSSPQGFRVKGGRDIQQGQKAHIIGGQSLCLQIPMQVIRGHSLWPMLGCVSWERPAAAQGQGQCEDQEESWPGKEKAYQINNLAEPSKEADVKN